MRTGKSLTNKVWIGSIGAMLAYEIYTLANKEENDTLSESVWRTFAKVPIASFGLGLLAGHFVWQSSTLYERLRQEKEDEQQG